MRHLRNRAASVVLVAGLGILGVGCNGDDTGGEETTAPADETTAPADDMTDETTTAPADDMTDEMTAEPTGSETATE